MYKTNVFKVNDAVWKSITRESQAEKTILKPDRKNDSHNLESAMRGWWPRPVIY